MGTRRSVARDIRWGVEWGLWIALMYSVLALIPAIIRAMTGATTVGGRVVSFLTILAIYASSGISAGAVLGLCKPLLGSIWGVMFVGVLCGLPIALAIRVAIFGVHGWSTDDVIAGLIFAVVLGGGGSISIRRALRSP